MGKLDNLSLKNAKVTDGKGKELFDGSGLSLKITKTNTKSWVYSYKMNGKKYKMGLGAYPSLSLEGARAKVYEYSQLRANGKNPQIEREKAKFGNNILLSDIAIKAFEQKNPNNPKNSDTWSDRHLKQQLSIYDRLILPYIGKLPIKDIELWQLVQIVENCTPNNQKKIKGVLSLIFKYARKKALINHNIVLELDIDKIAKGEFEFINPVEQPDEFSQLINDIDSFKGEYLTCKALQLITLLGLRPINIAELKWEQVTTAIYNNISYDVINISAEEMKMSRGFVQPLSKQSMNILNELRQHTGSKKYVFHSVRSESGHVSRDTLSSALRKTLKYDGVNNPKQTTHGFRKAIRTYISTIKGDYNWGIDEIRMILSHLKGGDVDNIYDKSQFLKERAEMLQLWADYIDDIKDNAIKLENMA